MTRNDLITDRTGAEIDAILELISQNLPLPADNLRISWDWRTLQRIETFTEHVANILRDMGRMPQVSVKTDWDETSTNSEAEGFRVFANLTALKAEFDNLALFPEVPASPSKLTEKTANDIEKILFYIDLLIENTRSVFYRTGTIRTGQVKWRAKRN